MAPKKAQAKYVVQQRIQHDDQLFEPGAEFNPEKCSDAQLQRLIKGGSVAIEGAEIKEEKAETLPDQDPSQTN